MHRGKTNLEFWWQKRNLYPPLPPKYPSCTYGGQPNGRKEGRKRKGRPTEDRKWEVFPRMENNDFCPMEVNGSSQGALWCSPFPAHEITNLLPVTPITTLMCRPTNRRASEGFKGNAAGPITSYKVCSLFHTVHSRSSSRNLQGGRSQVRVPLGVGWGGGVRATAAVLLSTAWQLTRAPHRMQHTCTCMNSDVRKHESGMWVTLHPSQPPPRLTHSTAPASTPIPELPYIDSNFLFWKIQQNKILSRGKTERNCVTLFITLIPHHSF